MLGGLHVGVAQLPLQGLLDPLKGAAGIHLQGRHACVSGRRLRDGVVLLRMMHILIRMWALGLLQGCTAGDQLHIRCSHQGSSMVLELCSGLSSAC